MNKEIRTMLVNELNKLGVKKSAKWIKEASKIISCEGLEGSKVYGMTVEQRMDDYLQYFNIK